MKYAREIKVGALAAVCLFLLFFGFNFLKGKNIFSPTNSYHGVFPDLYGLEEQAAVSIRGHKIGQVDAISYDFSRDSSFTVDISVNRNIALPEGTQMVLVADGLLGGRAIELRLPSGAHEPLARGSFLPTKYEPGLMESLQGSLMAHVDEAVQNIDSLVASLREQIAGGHIESTLENVDRVSSDLTSVSAELKRLMRTQVPSIVQNADTTVANLNSIVADLKAADLKATVARVDTTLESVQQVLTDVRSQDGTIGQLIYNKSLYNHIDATVLSADSLLTDLKAHPKRYVHFSIFGKKDK